MAPGKGFELLRAARSGRGAWKLPLVFLSSWLLSNVNQDCPPGSAIYHMGRNEPEPAGEYDVIGLSNPARHSLPLARIPPAFIMKPTEVQVGGVPPVFFGAT